MLGGRRRNTVAKQKGIAAEGSRMRLGPGQAENIRLTVAFAESYGLMIVSPCCVFTGAYGEEACCFSSRCNAPAIFVSLFHSRVNLRNL